MRGNFLGKSFPHNLFCLRRPKKLFEKSFSGLFKNFYRMGIKGIVYPCARSFNSSRSCFGTTTQNGFLYCCPLALFRSNFDLSLGLNRFCEPSSGRREAPQAAQGGAREMMLFCWDRTSDFRLSRRLLPPQAVPASRLWRSRRGWPPFLFGGRLTRPRHSPIINPNFHTPHGRAHKQMIMPFPKRFLKG